MTNFFLSRRKKLNKTQFNIAVEAGVTPAAVSAWEREENPPKLGQATKLAKVYGVSESRIEAEIVKMNRRRTAGVVR